ncbi:hypothetical protein IWQ57_005854, partial [Coemansia nantahalensis]
GGLHPLVADDDDQFIVRDEDDYGAVDGGDDIGPAGSIGRFHSYQNEQVPAAAAVSSDEDVVEDDTASDLRAADDSDDASESGRMSDFLRSQASDAADAARESSDGDPGGCDCVASPREAAVAAGRRRSLLVPSTEDEETGDDHRAATAPDELPPMPPRPSDADCGSFRSASAAHGVLTQSPGADGEPDGDAAPRPKGRVRDLLFRESKQRSLSSSELDNIVPADIGSWGPPPPLPSTTQPSEEDGPSGLAGATVPSSDPSSLGAGLAGAGEGAGRERADSFAGRRRRSRSQSAGVGISRAMVIQAAVKGQFPYLDAKTCEFVGQLKSDTVTLGGAAAGGGSRSRVAPAPAVPPLPASVSPAMKPAARGDDDDQLPAVPLPPQRPAVRPPSGLRVRSSAVASDSDSDGDEASAAGAAAGAAASSPFPSVPPALPPIVTTPEAAGERRPPAKQQPQTAEKRNGRPTYAAVANGLRMSA